MTAARLTLANPIGLVAGTGVRVSSADRAQEEVGPLGAFNLGADATLHMSLRINDGDMGGEKWKASCPSLTHPTGKNRCPKGAACRPFPEYFPTPVDLCEKIWSNSFKVSPEGRNSSRCLQKWFEPAQGNPNVAVVRLFASPAPAQELSDTLMVSLLCLLFLFCGLSSPIYFLASTSLATSFLWPLTKSNSKGWKWEADTETAMAGN
jgi:hypothetical protein